MNARAVYLLGSTVKPAGDTAFGDQLCRDLDASHRAHETHDPAHTGTAPQRGNPRSAAANGHARPVAWRNDIDAVVTVAAPPRGIMGPSSGSLCGYSAPQHGFAGHVLNDKDRAENPTQAPAILRAHQVGTVASAAPLRAVRQIGGARPAAMLTQLRIRRARPSGRGIHPSKRLLRKHFPELLGRNAGSCRG